MVSGTCYLNAILLDLSKIWSIKGVIFLFLVYELSAQVEAAPVTAIDAYKNVTFVSKAGRYLTIHKKGVTGKYAHTPYAKLEMHTLDFNGEFTIRGVKTGKYLAMNSAGNVYLATSETTETVFVDLRQVTSSYILIQSQLYPSKYLSISASGKVAASKNKKSDNSMFAQFRSAT